MARNIKKKKKSEIYLYHRLLRYPCFPVAPLKRNKIIHELKNGTVTILNRNATITDAQRLFSVVKLISEGKADIQHAAYYYDNEIEEISIVKIQLKDIKATKNRNDYYEFIESIEKISTMSIFYKDSESVTILKPIVKVTLNDFSIIIHFQKVFLDACLRKFYSNKNISLAIDYDMFTSLTKHSKNLYMYLTAHRDKKCFEIMTLLNRCLFLLTISNISDAIKKLKKCLNELVLKNYIKRFYFQNNKVYIQY
ncbi:hypothetical protein [Thermodesulfovibrio yellowstonii]|uniref:hypothetical protein n=1 Tax=Thermodesulfovibrio yellowstonii TaxID=28262 RepID=UPI0024B389DC|nr:hypothetical protein [Thermodesulfovibrio yellowstonii]MDI6864642.1 hypothetical protein [Thermodesulfovibrio yellowstonii]